MPRTDPNTTTYAPALAARLRNAGFHVHTGKEYSALRVKASKKNQVHITVDYPDALRGIVLDDLRSQLMAWGYAVRDLSHKGDPFTVVASR